MKMRKRSSLTAWRVRGIWPECDCIAYSSTQMAARISLKCRLHTTSNNGSSCWTTYEMIGIVLNLIFQFLGLTGYVHFSRWLIVHVYAKRFEHVPFDKINHIPKTDWNHIKFLGIVSLPLRFCDEPSCTHTRTHTRAMIVDVIGCRSMRKPH